MERFVATRQAALGREQEHCMNLKLAIGILTIAMMGAPGIAVAQDNRDTSMQTATGCVQKSLTGNIYMLTDEDGKTWSLRSKTVPLGPHVGQTVTVTGTIPQEPNGSSDTTPQNHLLVTKLDTVRAGCEQP
jgi:hypothetical protein